LPEDAGPIDHLSGDDGPGTDAGAGSDAPADRDPTTATGGANPIRVDPAIEAECTLRTVDRLDEIPGISVHNAQDILAEIGTDMSRFPTPEHLVSWASCARAPSSPGR
jgi:transposase